MAEPGKPPPTTFKPEIGLMSLTFLIVGSMVGSGIFFLPGAMLSFEQAGTPWLVMLAWIIGAAIALAGGLTFAELGAAFPKAGGQYVFLRDSLGKAWGFLFSWTAFSVVQSGTIAAVAVAMSNGIDYILRHEAPWAAAGSGPWLGTVADPGLPGEATPWEALTLPGWGVGFLAVAVISLLSWVNLRGVRQGAGLNNAATVAKMVALFGIMGIAFVAGRNAGNFAEPARQFGTAALGGFALAVSSSLFAYDGFAQATFVAAEVKDAKRVIPRAIVTATVLVAAVYLLATAAVYYALPAGEISPAAMNGDEPIASEAVAKALGSGFGIAVAAAVALAIVVSTLGTTNAYVLSSPRIYYAVAKDREFPQAFAKLSRHRTPTFGLWYGAIWASLLTLSGGYFELANLVVFGLYVFYLATMVGYFVLKRRHPEAFASFKAPLRPLPAIFFGLASIAVLASYLVPDSKSLWNDVLAGEFSVSRLLANTSLFAALLIGSGLVVYFLTVRSRPPGTPVQDETASIDED